MMNTTESANKTRMTQFLQRSRSCQNTPVCTSIFVIFAGLTALTACDEQDHFGQSKNPTATSKAVAKRAGNLSHDEQKPYSSRAIEVVDWPKHNENLTVKVRKTRQVFSQTIENLKPVVTRAGTLRFTDPLINDPDTATIFLHRLANETVSVPYRQALAEALGRTGGNYAMGACWLLSSEPNDQVRSALIASLRNAPARWSAQGLQLGFKDPSSIVRAQAAITTSFRRDRDRFIGPLVELLGDSAIEVQVEATRSLASIPTMQDPAVLRQMSLNLNHKSPELRLHTLRSIHRIDRNFARTLPAINRLRDDSDPRIRRVAMRINLPPH